MEPRPQLKIKITALDKFLDGFGYFLLLGIWLIAVFGYIFLPDNIPVHYNGLGQVTNYGNKIMIFILPIIATIIFSGMSFLVKRPHILNYFQPITKDNFRQQYMIAARMLRFMKLAVVFIFFLITLFTYLISKGITNGLGSWFMPFVLILLTIIPLYFFIKSGKKKNDFSQNI